MEGERSYVTQYYSGETSFSNATRISLPALTTLYNIDAELSTGGRIAGTVTNAATGAAIEGVLACAFSPGGEIGGCAITNPGGEYIISGLAAGQYVVEFLGGPDSYLTQYYDGGYVASEAQLVTVAVNTTTANIDATMLPGVFKAPVDLTAPTVSGTAAVGGTLSCVGGSWSANPPPSFAYVWLRDGTPIPSATQGAYTVQSADAGHGLSCEVEATNRIGSKKGVGRAVSSPVGIAEGTPVAAATSTGTAKSAASSGPLVALEASKIHISKQDTAQVRIRCERARCQGSLELVAHTAGRAILAKGSFALAEGQSAAVTLRLTRAGVKRLAHIGAHRLAVRLTALVHAGKTVSAPTSVVG